MHEEQREELVGATLSYLEAWVADAFCHEFRKLQELLYGETVEKKVIDAFLNLDEEPLALYQIAELCQLSRNASMYYSKNGKRYTGDVRRVVERMDKHGLLVKCEGGRFPKYRLNHSNRFARLLLYMHDDEQYPTRRDSGAESSFL